MSINVNEVSLEHSLQLKNIAQIHEVNSSVFVQIMFCNV